MTKGDKIRRVLDTRNLDLTGEELATRWQNGDDEDSLRGLAFEFNCHVLDNELRENGHMLDPETVKIKTSNLIDEDSIPTKLDLRDRGVDVESVLADSVTYQTMYSYLTTIQDVEYESRTRNKNNAVTVLSRACTKLEAIAQEEYVV